MRVTHSGTRFAAGMRTYSSSVPTCPLTTVLPSAVTNCRILALLSTMIVLCCLDVCIQTSSIIYVQHLSHCRMQFLLRKIPLFQLLQWFFRAHIARATARKPYYSKSVSTVGKMPRQSSNSHPSSSGSTCLYSQSRSTIYMVGYLCVLTLKLLSSLLHQSIQLVDMPKKPPANSTPGTSLSPTQCHPPPSSLHNFHQTTKTTETVLGIVNLGMKNLLCGAPILEDIDNSPSSIIAPHSQYCNKSFVSVISTFLRPPLTLFNSFCRNMFSHTRIALHACVSKKTVNPLPCRMATMP